MRYLLFLVLAMLIAPFTTNAITISEIYYDPTGTDAGHEWIEIYNDESELVDLSGWKLFENNVNHGITAVNGDLLLPAGAYAVIADNAVNVAVDFPGIQYLYDSAFSLNNTGELLAIKDSDLEIIDEVTYVAVDAASGTGGSLNRINGLWTVRMASPGAAPNSTAPSQDDDTAIGSETKKPTPSHQTTVA